MFVYNFDSMEIFAEKIFADREQNCKKRKIRTRKNLVPHAYVWVYQ